MTRAFFGSSGHFSSRKGNFASESSVHADASGHPSAPIGSDGGDGGGGGVFIAATPHRDRHPLLSAGSICSGSGSCPKYILHEHVSKFGATYNPTPNSSLITSCAGNLHMFTHTPAHCVASRYLHFLTFTTVTSRPFGPAIVSRVVGPNIHSAISEATAPVVSRSTAPGRSICATPVPPGGIPPVICDRMIFPTIRRRSSGECWRRRWCAASAMAANDRTSPPLSESGLTPAASAKRSALTCIAVLSSSESS
mmetsp:Transcript_1084/g.4116  ORF Transcript_1084/g.4116 Transcript_1084/m.4116 type:complete len:252 (+) Transcript_1084:69-824(+)